MIKAGIMGATGYAGAEVLRICANHPEFDVAVITSDSEAGQRIADIYPAFHGVYDNLVLEPHATDSLLSCDVVFTPRPSCSSAQRSGNPKLTVPPLMSLRRAMPQARRLSLAALAAM